MDDQQIEQARAQVLQIFEAGVSRVKGFNAVADFLQQNSLSGEYRLVAVGKAASSMSLGALSVAGEQVVDGLVITKHHHTEDELRAYSNISTMESDHPVPGEASLAAGRALLDYIDNAPQDAKFLVLISGGASSLLEVLAEGMSLEKLATLSKILLAKGFDITQMNRIRRAISQVKGGRLASHIDGRETVALMISDVPGDDPAVIGSGPLTRVVEDISQDDMPQEITNILNDVDFTPVPEQKLFDNIDAHVIATLDDAKNAAAKCAESLGFDVVVHPEFLEGPAEAKTVEICNRLSSLEQGIHIWGGETTLILPPNPGRGGRNQQIAVAAAKELAGNTKIVFLAAGTDGTDGPTPDAGGIVDGNSKARGDAAGLDIQHYLDTADVGNYLEKTNDLVTTGPTGTNVMDLIVALKT